MLVTGGAGFIGSHLVRVLLQEGHEVRVLDNFSSGARRSLTGMEVELIVGDIRDPSLVERATQGVDTLFHQAALVSASVSMTDPTETYDVNMIGSLNVLEAARKAGVRRVVLASTCAVYGNTAPPARESAPTTPLSPYSASKLAMEQAADLYARVYGTPTVCLRYFNVYGPQQPLESEYAAVIPSFIRAMLAGEAVSIHGDGLQTRDFVAVHDVVRANLLAAVCEVGSGEVVNIGSGRSVSILHLAERLERLLPGSKSPRFGPPRPGDIRTSAADLSKAKQALGYRPEFGLDQGLQATIEWFRSKQTQEPQ